MTNTTCEVTSKCQISCPGLQTRKQSWIVVLLRMKLGHRRSSKITSPTPQSPGHKQCWFTIKQSHSESTSRNHATARLFPRACMSPSRITSWSGQLVKGLHDSNPMCHQSSPEAVCSAQFQNIIPMPLNISPKTSLAYKQVISFMIEGWRQFHRKTVTSSCARETPESSRFGNILPRDFQRTLSMPHHPRPWTRTLMTAWLQTQL